MRMQEILFECQHIAQNNYNEPVEILESEIEYRFSEEPEILSFAYDTTIHYWEEIQNDLGCTNKFNYDNSYELEINEDGRMFVERLRVRIDEMKGSVSYVKSKSR